MKTGRSKIGKEGEDFACAFLKKKGWKIVEKNASEKWGELDIVAQSTEGALVFVEVKTMSGFSPDGIQPENQMTNAKMKKFKKTALAYANAHPNLYSEERGFRLDVVALVKIGNDFLVRHYENVF